MSKSFNRKRIMVETEMGIKVNIVEDYDKMSKEAAKVISSSIRKKPNLVLGLATGNTPIKCYKELVRMHKKEGLDFSEVVTFNLDEYLGLPSDHPQSFRNYMKEKLFNHVNIKPENTYIPPTKPENPQNACQEYEERIKAAGGIDLQLLGIGTNGHIGFNEPSTSFDSRTRVVKLSEQTIQDNSQYFDSAEEVPKQAISMGIGTIMEAEKIILLASGTSKAEAIAKTLEGPKTTNVPASVLQSHSHATTIIDEAAASDLSRKNF